MQRDEIIEMARQAGFIGNVDIAVKELEAFAKLVAAKEREECAKVCEEMRDAWVNRPVPLLGYAVEHDGAAKAIRARGEA